MQTIMKKLMLTSLIFSLAFGFSLGAGATSTDYTPTVKIKKAKNTSVTLEVVSAGLKKKNVKIKVKINNVDTDTDSSVVFEKKLNKSGKADVKISSLTQNVEYSFKVAIKKDSDDDYSDYSDAVVVNAEGVYDYDPELNIEDTTSTTVVLDVTSIKLKKKKVTVKVRIENKDSDTLETRFFNVSLSKNGKAEITIDNLSSDTDYAFKVLVKKKSKDKGFSDASSEESVSTED